MLTILAKNSHENLFLEIDDNLNVYRNYKLINTVITENDLFVVRDHRFS